MKENILSESILNWLNEVHLNQRMYRNKSEENIKLDYTCCGVGVGAGNRDRVPHIQAPQP